MRIFVVFLVSLFCVSLLTKISLAQTDVVDTSTQNIVDSTSSVTEISKSKYVTGGVLGTVFGFGIGHGVQGRWSNDKGWIFTSAELVTLGVGTYYLQKSVGNSVATIGEIACAIGTALLAECKLDSNSKEEPNLCNYF